MDLAAMNVAVFVVSVLASLYGYILQEAFVLILFFGSGFALILWGVSGFFLSSASFWSLVEFLRKRRTKEDKETPEKTEKTKPKMSSGQRFVMIGVMLLVESLLLSLLL